MLLLIDLSYYIFYRYYATYNWYIKQDNSQTEVMKDPIYVEKYDKMFEQILCDLQKKHELLWKDIYFAKDCTRDEIWRMKLFPQYKQSRDDKLETFDKMIFKHTICTLIPRLQEKYTGCHILSVENMEADDLIAVTKKYVREKEVEREIVIVTNDNDYLQLIDNYTLIVNLQGCDLKSRIDCTPKEYLHRKIIMGDKSDNIPSIAKKIGEKTSAKLSNDNDALMALLNKNEQAKTQYDLNKTLISFEMIPENLRKLGIESYIRTK